MPRLWPTLPTAFTLLFVVTVLSARSVPARAEVAAPPPSDPAPTGRPGTSTPPSRARSAQGRPAADDDAVIALILEGIRRVGPGAATMTRSARALILSNLRLFSRAARAVPAEAEGALGYRLTGIRARGVLGAIGLRNGDILLGINGRPTSSPQEVLAVYTGLRNASTWTLRIHRRGAEQTLTVRVVDDPPAASPAAPVATP